MKIAPVLFGEKFYVILCFTLVQFVQVAISTNSQIEIKNLGLKLLIIGLKHEKLSQNELTTLSK